MSTNGPHFPHLEHAAPWPTWLMRTFITAVLSGSVYLTLSAAFEKMNSEARAEWPIAWLEDKYQSQDGTFEIKFPERKSAEAQARVFEWGKLRVTPVEKHGKIRIAAEAVCVETDGLVADLVISTAIHNKLKARLTWEDEGGKVQSAEWVLDEVDAAKAQEQARLSAITH